jgi:hypothetical protein
LGDRRVSSQGGPSEPGSVTVLDRIMLLACFGSLSLQLAAWVQELNSPSRLNPRFAGHREARYLDACSLLFELVLISSPHPCNHQSTIHHSFPITRLTDTTSHFDHQPLQTLSNQSRAIASPASILASTPRGTNTPHQYGDHTHTSSTGLPSRLPRRSLQSKTIPPGIQIKNSQSDQELLLVY